MKKKTTAAWQFSEDISRTFRSSVSFLRHAYSVNNFVHRLTKHTSCVGKKNASHLTKSARPCRLSFEVFFLFFFFASLCYDLGCSRHSSSASNAASSGELAFFSCLSSISPCLWRRAPTFSRGPVTSLYKQPLSVAIRSKQIHRQETSVQRKKKSHFTFLHFLNKVGWNRWCFVVDITP